MTSEPASADPIKRTAGAARFRLILARLALGWERAWLRLWVPASCLGLLVAVALTEVLSSLHGAAQLAIVIAAFIAIGALAWRNLRTFAFPTREEARARLEALSPVTHRPLTAVEDVLPPGADAGQQMLWELHQKRAREELARLRVSPPAPGVATRDPFAARMVVILLLFVAFAGGWSDLSSRLMRTVIPSFGRADTSTSVKLWITPPAYTHRPPTYVELPAPAGTTPPRTLEIREGSTALAIVLGAQDDVFLNIGETASKLERLADSSRRGETTLTPGKRLELLQNKKAVAAWDVKWIEDAAPTIRITNTPAAVGRWQLRVDYEASDDYGVETVTAHMNLPPGSSAAAQAPSEFPLDVPPFAPMKVSQTTVNDLTAHLWAGMTVQMHLTAADTAGHTAKSDNVVIVLPERLFNHPVARELAKQRKNLIADTASSKVAADALTSVADILRKPDAFNGDALAHLAISASKYRLANETREVANLSVPSLLWHAAVRIEDGNLAVAEQRLAAAQSALRKALERGAPQEELNRLAQEMKDALSDFAKAQNENKQDGSFSAAMNEAAEEAAKAIDKLRETSEFGSPEDMKKALADLEKQMQDLNQQQAQAEDPTGQIKAAEKMLERMQSLTEKQSKLLNDTFDRAQEQEKREAKAREDMSKRSADENRRQEQQRQQDAKAAGDKGASQQDEIRKELDQLMTDLSQMTGTSDKPLQDAGKAMEEARDLLRKPSLQQGAEAQGEALSLVQQGVQGASEAILQSLLNKGMGSAVQMPGFARPQFAGGKRSGQTATGDVDVPTGPDPEGVASRVRSILEEIRARAGDRTRSSEEQDYLHRLMKKF